jgi:hypothetical protein
MTDKNVKPPDDVLAFVNERAEAEGPSVDEMAAPAVKTGLEEGRWRRLVAAGRRYGKQSGYTEGDIEAVIQSFRKENRGS